MRKADVESLRSSLQRRRSQVQSATRHAASEIQDLRGAERDPEWEEQSQSEQQQSTLTHLHQVEQRQLALIDAALRRLDEGRYGTCRSCGDDIPAERLAAVPFVLVCLDCARHAEQLRPR
jgi:DnaK suppressor protein